MVGDYMTKPLQGALFRKFRDLIMGVVSVTDPAPSKTKHNKGRSSSLAPPANKGRRHRSVLGETGKTKMPNGGSKGHRQIGK